jgi:hypothetical protein
MDRAGDSAERNESFAGMHTVKRGDSSGGDPIGEAAPSPWLLATTIRHRRQRVRGRLIKFERRVMYLSEIDRKVLNHVCKFRSGQGSMLPGMDC